VRTLKVREKNQSKALVMKSSTRKEEKNELKLDGLNFELSFLKGIFVVRDNGKIPS
jgi:hypothetical protein